MGVSSGSLLYLLVALGWDYSSLGREISIRRRSDNRGGGVSSGPDALRIYLRSAQPASGDPVSHLYFPARYYVSLLQTVLLAGDVWAVILPNLAMLAAIATMLFVLTRLGFKKQLD